MDAVISIEERAFGRAWGAISIKSPYLDGRQLIETSDCDSPQEAYELAVKVAELMNLDYEMEEYDV
jgi:hypothetical protein